MLNIIGGKLLTRKEMFSLPACTDAKYLLCKKLKYKGVRSSNTDIELL